MGTSESSETTRLTADNIAFLRRLGDIYRAAQGYRATQIALDDVLETALQHRTQGVGKTEISRALGIPWGELTHRLDELAHKPGASSPQTSAPGRGSQDQQLYRPDDLPIPVNQRETNPSLQISDGIMQSIQSSSLSLSLSLSSSFSTSRTDLYPGMLPLGAWKPVKRRILFLSGDPNPGRNDFGEEAATIRDAIEGSLAEIREVHKVRLAELSAVLDKHSPTVLHMAGHRTFHHGLHLNDQNGLLGVSDRDFCTQVMRARRPPRLAVLSFCDSSALAERLSGTVPAVISWPCEINDRQALLFAERLYLSLIGQRSAGESMEDAYAALDRSPPATAPALYGNPCVQAP